MTSLANQVSRLRGRLRTLYHYLVEKFKGRMRVMISTSTAFPHISR